MLFCFPIFHFVCIELPIELPIGLPIELPIALPFRYILKNIIFGVQDSFAREDLVELWGQEGQYLPGLQPESAKNNRKNIGKVQTTWNQMAIQ